MVKSISLVKGIGNVLQTREFYDNWSNKYDETLKDWNYQAPNKCLYWLKKKINFKPKKILDLACGTGLSGEALIKIYKKSYIYGSDISSKSLLIAEKKKIYKDLKKYNFESKYNYRKKFDLITMIGAMTYCKNFNKLFENIDFYLNQKGYFIFSHRVDLWERQDFYNILKNLSNKFKITHISRPCNYLPSNINFKNKIKIRIVLLQKC